MAVQWNGWKIEGCARFDAPSAKAQGTRRVMICRARERIAVLQKAVTWAGNGARNRTFVTKQDAVIGKLFDALAIIKAQADPEWFLARREAVKRDPLAAVLETAAPAEEQREAA